MQAPPNHDCGAWLDADLIQPSHLATDQIDYHIAW